MNENMQKRLFLAVALMALMLFLVRVFAYDRLPLNWDDEACFVDPARTLITEGRMATPVHEGLVPGIGQRTYWMPPLLFVLYAPIAAHAGAEIEPARIFILALSLIAMIAAWLAAWQAVRAVDGSARPGDGAALAGAAVFAGGEGFLMSAAVFRPDIPAVLLIALSIAFSLWYLREPRNRLYLFAVACAGLASLAHPIGWPFLAVLFLVPFFAKGPTARGRITLILLAGIVLFLVLLPWFIYIMQAPDDFAAQMLQQFARKTARYADWASRVDLARRFVKQPVPLVPLLLPFLSLYAARRREPATRRIAIWLLVSTLFFRLIVAYTAEMWYGIYDLPWLAVNLAFWTGLQSRAGWLRPAAAVVAMLVFYYSAAFFVSNRDLIMDTRAVGKLDQKIAAIARDLPKGSRVAAFGFPCRLSPLIDAGLDVRLPRFLEDREKRDRFFREAGSVVFILNHSNYYRVLNDVNIEFLPEELRRAARECPESGDLFDVCVIKRPKAAPGGK